MTIERVGIQAVATDVGSFVKKLNSMTNAVTRFKAAASDLGAIQIQVSGLEKISGLLLDITNDFRRASSSAKVLAKDLGRISAATKKASTSTKELVTQEKALDPAIRQASDEIERADQSLRSVGQSAQIASSGVGSLTDSLSPQRVAADLAEEAFAKFGQRLVALDAQIVNVGGRLESAQQRFKDLSGSAAGTTDQLQRQIGVVAKLGRDAQLLADREAALRAEFVAVGGSAQQLTERIVRIRTAGAAAAAAIDLTGTSASRAADAFRRFGERILRAQARVVDTAARLRLARTELDRLENSSKTTGTQLDRQRAAVGRLANTLAIANVSLEKITASFTEAGGEIEKVDASFDRISSSIRDASGEFQRLTGTLSPQQIAIERATEAWDEFADEIVDLDLGTKRLNERLQVQRRILGRLTGTLDRSSDQFLRQQTVVKSLQTEFTRSQQRLSTLRAEFVRAGGDSGRLEAQIRRIDSSLKRLATGAGLLGSIEGFTRLGRSVLPNLARSFNSAAQTTLRIGQQFRSLARDVSFFISLPAALAIKEIADAGIEFESAFAGVLKTVDGAGLGVNALTAGGIELRNSLRELAQVIPEPIEGLARIGELGGQLGVPLEGILSFVDTIARLVVSTDLSVDQAAQSLAQFVAITSTLTDAERSTGGLDGEFQSISATVVELGNNLATTEQRIVNFSLRIAAIGRLAGFTQADIIGIAAAFSSVGIPAERGGTAVQKVIQTIIQAVEEGGDKLEIFARTAGLTAQEFADVFARDGAEAFRRFVEGLGTQGTAAITTLNELGLADRRLVQAFLSLSASGGRLTESIELARGSFREFGDEQSNLNALQIESQKRFETTQSQLQLLTNTFTELGIELSSFVLPLISSLAADLRRAIDFIRDADRETQQLVLGFTAFVAVLGPALLALGGLIVAVGTVGTVIAALGVAVTGTGLLIAAVFVAPIVAAGLAIGALATLFVLSFKKIEQAISRQGRDLGQLMLEFGKNITILFARGIVAGLVFVIRALNLLGRLITSFLAPGSPPKLLPDLDDWGKEAAEIYLAGWVTADFSVFETLANPIEAFLRSLGGDLIPEDSLNDILVATQDALREIVDDFNEFGMASSQAIAQLASAIGSNIFIINEYVQAVGELNAITRELTAEQERLNEVQREFSDILKPLNLELQEVRDRQQDIRDEERIAELQEIIADESEDAGAREIAQLALRELLIRRQIRDAQRERDATVAPIEDRIDALQDEQSQAQERVDTIRQALEFQTRQNELLKEQEELLGGIGSALGELPGLFDGAFDDFDFPEVEFDFAQFDTSLGSLANISDDIFDEITLDLGDTISVLESDFQGLGDSFADTLDTFRPVLDELGGEFGLLIDKLDEEIGGLTDTWSDVFAVSLPPFLETANQLIQTTLEDGVVAGIDEGFGLAVLSLAERFARQEPFVAALILEVADVSPAVRQAFQGAVAISRLTLAIAEVVLEGPLIPGLPEPEIILRPKIVLAEARVDKGEIDRTGEIRGSGLVLVPEINFADALRQAQAAADPLAPDVIRRALGITDNAVRAAATRAAREVREILRGEIEDAGSIFVPIEPVILIEPGLIEDVGIFAATIIPDAGAGQPAEPGEVPERLGFFAALEGISAEEIAAQFTAFQSGISGIARESLTAEEALGGLIAATLTGSPALADAALASLAFAQSLQESAPFIDAISDSLNNANGPLADYFASALRSGEATVDLDRELFNAAQQAGASAFELSLLAATIDGVGSEEIKAALKSAILREEIARVAKAFADGDLTVEEARQGLILFQEKLEEDFEIIIDATSVKDAEDDLGDLEDAAENTARTYSLIIDIQTVGNFPDVPADFDPGRVSEAGAVAGQLGGFTGIGPRNQLAGFVHRNEFILPANLVNQIGVPVLEALRRTGNVSGFIAALAGGARTRGFANTRQAALPSSSALSNLGSSIQALVNAPSQQQLITSPMQAPMVSNTTNRNVTIDMVNQFSEARPPQELFFDVVAALTAAGV